MPKFVLADNSLAPEGGHHFEFAEAILQVAERAGFEPIIGANVGLAESVELAKRWPTFRVFRSSIYHDYNLFYLSRWDEKEAKKKALAFPGPLASVSNWINAFRMRLRRDKWAVKRAERGKGFVEGCRELFRQVELAAGDVVMLPTVSDVELEMLGQYFRENPQSAVAEWHLFFHNNFLLGRPPEYDGQDFRLVTMRKSLQSCLEAGNGHKLHFYTTTDQLADQFERLKLGQKFGRLTFPVREVLRKPAAQSTSGPKHVVCAGGFRDERGQFALPEIVKAIWNDLLKPGRAQILVQRDKPEWQVPLPEEAGVCAPAGEPVVYHPHPLSTEEYNRLIQQADVGLLLHDAHSYYSRLSAVYQEYACAGIPVIVPAGCWLGDQVAEENHEHIEFILRETSERVVPHEEPEWIEGGSILPGLTRSKFSFRGPQTPLVAVVDVPRRATELVVQCRWLSPDGEGQYARISLESPKSGGQWQREAQVVVRPRGSAHDLAVMFHVPAKWSGVRLVMENAFASGSIAVSQPQLTFLAVPEAGEAGLPTGNSGLSFAVRSEIPRLLREMLAHYSHYRARAQEKSAEWCGRLTPDVTMAKLLTGNVQSAETSRLNRAA